MTSYRVTWKELEYMDPVDFTKMCMSRDRCTDEVRTITISTGISDDFELNVYMDREPKYWTSYDDEYIVFDAYQVAKGSTLVSSDIQMFVTEAKEYDIFTNTARPPIPNNFDTYFINQVISIASEELRQIINEQAAMTAKRQYTKLRELEAKVKTDREYADYGKKAGRTVRHTRRRRDGMGSSR